jgi:hypothetical protein
MQAQDTHHRIIVIWLQVATYSYLIFKKLLIAIFWIFLLNRYITNYYVLRIKALLGGAISARSGTSIQYILVEQEPKRDAAT